MSVSCEFELLRAIYTCFFAFMLMLFNFLFADGARAALSLGGTMLGFYPVRVLPSKTAILPVNPTFLPRVWVTLLYLSA